MVVAVALVASVAVVAFGSSFLSSSFSVAVAVAMITAVATTAVAVTTAAVKIHCTIAIWQRAWGANRLIAPHALL